MARLPSSRPIPAWAVLLTGVSLATGGCGAEVRQATDAAPGPEGGNPPKGEPAQAIRAIDGDTLDVEVDGRRQRVRLLGIDAPESTTKRTGRAECGGQQATDAMRALVRRSPDVTLATDPSQDATDQYGRLLAYVTSAQGGSTWAEQLLTAGWAKVYEQRGEPIMLDGAFRAAAAAAKASGAGVWQLCGGDFRKPQ